MPNCEWGRPCDCTECSGSRRDSALKSQCSRFGCNNESTKTVSAFSCDGKDVGSYSTRGYCNTCYKVWYEEETKTAARQAVEYQKKKEEQCELYAKFLELSKEENILLAPIKELDWWGRSYCTGVRSYLPQNDLLIQKVRGRWMYCKNRERLFYQLELEKFYIIQDPRK